MESIRGEVSNKIRSAIKAKLMELGAYVDDELPDYIMVMVANKRSQQQMEDDLQLFLGDSTVTFTSWLHTVLSKLQQVTVNSAELKKGSEKKRPSSEEPKKEKRKKIKKERPEKHDAATDERRSREKLVEPNDTHLRNCSIKSEPVDHVGDEVSKNHKPNSESQNDSAKVQKSKSTEEEDEEDFINLKADVEGDMWGDSEETSVIAAKGTNIESEQQSVHRTPATGFQDSQPVQPGQRLNSVPEETSSNPMPPATVSASPGSPPKSGVAEPKSATRIIRISETSRQEQETLKPASKIVRDPQSLVKRVFQSHIVSQKHVQEKSERPLVRSSSSHFADNQTRRSDHRRNRIRDHEDLRETLRKERQKEREHIRNQEREQRRSRGETHSRNSRSTNTSLVRTPLSYKDENESDHGLASVVQVKPRPKIPAALQANRSLLKAVAEAQKSVTTPIVRSELSNKALKEAFMKKSIKDRLETPNRSSVKSRLASKEQLDLKQSTRLPSRETLRKMSFTVLSKETAPSKESKESVLAEYGDEDPFILDPSLNILIQVPASPVAERRPSPDPAQTEKVRRWIKDVEEATKTETTPSNINADLETVTETDADPFGGIETSSKPASDVAIDDSDDALDVDTTSLKTSDINSVVTTANQPPRQNQGPQFVVTLDGLDPMLLHSYSEERENDNILKQKSKILEDFTMHEDKEDDSLKEQLLRQELLRQQAAAKELKAGRSSSVTTPPASASSKAPVKRPASPHVALEIRPSKVTSSRASNLERCKFWPACKNKEKCEFHHPSVQCKLFPKCIFADRCLYIHPTCRFNTACTRADCVYAHTTPKSAHKSPPIGNSHTGGQSIKQACKFFPNCSNHSCPYIHPMVCKFGTHCSKPNCQFIHSEKGLNTKHKWVRH